MLIEAQPGRPRIVTVGGGSGGPITIDALHYTNQVPFIEAITPTTDYGGATGARRLASRGEEIAYSDSMRTMFALVHPNNRNAAYDVVKKWFILRNKYQNFVLGQEIMHQGFEEGKAKGLQGFQEIEAQLNAVGLKLNGTVLPATEQSAHIVVETTSERTYVGEQLLDEHAGDDDGIENMWLTPEVDAYGPATEAIKSADRIYLSLGSLYGSVLASFLPRGMKEALKEFSGEMYVITNLMSTPLETNKITPKGYADVVERYTSRRPDGLIVPEMSRREFESKHQDAALGYKRERAHFLGWDDYTLMQAEREGLKIVTHKATRVIFEDNSQKHKIVRHDKPELGVAIARTLPQAA